MEGMKNDSFPPDEEATLQWRPLTEASLPILHQLVQEVEGASFVPYPTSDREIAFWVQETPRWVGIYGEDQAGQVQAAALVAISGVDQSLCETRSFLQPRLQSKQMWETMMRWQLREAKELLKESGKPKPGLIRTSVHPYQAGLEGVLRSKGFSWVSSTVEMRRLLQDVPEVPNLGPYLGVEPWAEEYEDSARRLFNRLMSGDGTVSRQQWLAHRELFQPEWSFVAVSRQGDRPELAGFLMASAATETGTQEGFIDLLAVSEAAASMDTFQALALASMGRQAAAGVTHTGATVDEPGDPLTTRLYEGLGFTRFYEVKSYSAPC